MEISIKLVDPKPPKKYELTLGDIKTELLWCQVDELVGELLMEVDDLEYASTYRDINR